jgi:hypothetical protein
VTKPIEKKKEEADQISKLLWAAEANSRCSWKLECAAESGGDGDGDKKKHTIT